MDEFAIVVVSFAGVALLILMVVMWVTGEIANSLLAAMTILLLCRVADDALGY